MLSKVAIEDNEHKEEEFNAGIKRYTSLLLKLKKDRTLDIITSFEGTAQDNLNKNLKDLNVLERAHLVKGQTKETNHNVYRQYELTKEGAELVEKFSKETGNGKEPHQTRTLGAPSSQEIPIGGVEPNQIPCPDCGKTFKTHSEMERHRDTTHHETKGHE
jgi:hypothetical protein